MMPSDCHIDWSQSPCTSTNADSANAVGEMTSSDLSVSGAESDHSADHVHTVHLGPGICENEVKASSHHVKLCFEVTEDTCLSESSLSLEKECLLEECRHHDGDAVVFPPCQKSDKKDVSIEELDVCDTDSGRFSFVTRSETSEEMPEADVYKTRSSRNNQTMLHGACSTSTHCYREQREAFVEKYKHPSECSDECDIESRWQGGEETRLSDIVLKEANVHHCLSSLCNSKPLRTEGNRTFAAKEVWDKHVLFDSNVDCSCTSKRTTCFPFAMNHNSNADTDNTPSSLTDGLSAQQGSSAVGSVSLPDDQVQSGGGQEEQALLRTHSSDSVNQAQSGEAATESRSAGDVYSLPASRVTSIQSGFELEPVSSLESTGSCPLMIALNLDENQSDSEALELSSCSNEDGPDSLPLISAMQVEETEEEKVAAEPFPETSMAPASSVDISDIPDEVLLKIFSYLRPAELCGHVTLVCKEWHRLAYDLSLWRKLDLSRVRMNGFQLCQLILRVPGAIRYLDMSGMDNLSNAEMAVVAENCPDLTHLDLGFVDDLTCTMMHAILTACPHLQFLNVEGCRNANNDMMRELTASPGSALKRLNFSHCSLVDESLWLMMQHIHGITHLNIDGISWISELVVQHLASEYSDSLESWELDGNELTDNTLDAVSTCHRLKTLSISFCEQLTDLGLKHLKRLENLDKLILRKGSSFSSAALTDLLSSPTLQNLTYLDLSECQQMSDEGVQALTRTCGQKLQTLCLSWCWDITDTGMEYVVNGCSQMVTMYLVGLHRLEGLWLPVAIQTMPSLVYISFEQCNEVVDMVIEEAVRDKSDLAILNYYGEIFMLRNLPM